MTTVLSILNVFPELFNVNGDAENAAVLAARSRWAGHSARVTRLSLGDAAPVNAPGIVVLGSTTDAALPEAVEALRLLAPALTEWAGNGVPIFAVGTGWELLSESIELSGGVLRGLGLVPGRAAAAATRASDDLVVSSRFGRLIGYENHARDYQLAEGTEPLGKLVYGRGNGGQQSTEGLIHGSIMGTHLHGPALAKNPTLADYLLSNALGDVYDRRTVPTGRVDDIARAARNVIATRLELPTE